MKKTKKTRLFYQCIELTAVTVGALILIPILQHEADRLSGTGLSYFLRVLILLLIILPVLMLLFRFIIPVLRLNKIIQKLHSENRAELLSSFNALDENSALLQEFRDLIGQLDEMKMQESNLELAKRYAQLDALQQQINPHFLYNTLDTIRGQAFMSGQKSIEAMALALSKIFRYSISNYNDLVPITDELDIIDNYFLIQNTRFSNKFSIYFEIDEDCAKERIPKMTIQPLVENAIKHGLEPKLEHGTITIKVHKTQSLIVIDIEDDGIGIEFDRLDQLNNVLHNTNAPIIKKESGHSIGLYNINSRLRLLYGERANMTIYSVPDSGTDIRISLPLQS